MMEFLKKSVAFGVGAAAFSAEKMKQFADEMVARGEMSSDDAKKFVDDMTAKADEEKKTVQEWVNEQVSRVLQQAGAADVARVERLELRIAALEKRIADLSSEVEEDFAGTKRGMMSDELRHDVIMDDIAGPEGCD